MANALMFLTSRHLENASLFGANHSKFQIVDNALNDKAGWDVDVTDSHLVTQ